MNRTTNDTHQEEYFFCGTNPIPAPPDMGVEEYLDGYMSEDEYLYLCGLPKQRLTEEDRIRLTKYEARTKNVSTKH